MNRNGNGYPRILLATLLLLVIVAIGYLLTTRPAYPHTTFDGMTYDASCCNGKDCQEIPDEAVKPVSGGWHVNRTGEVIPYKDTLESTNGHFHRCQYTTGPYAGKTRCLYAPPFGQ